MSNLNLVQPSPAKKLPSHKALARALPDDQAGAAVEKMGDATQGILAHIMRQFRLTY